MYQWSQDEASATIAALRARVDGLEKEREFTLRGMRAAAERHQARVAELEAENKRMKAVLARLRVGPDGSVCPVEPTEEK